MDPTAIVTIRFLLRKRYPERILKAAVVSRQRQEANIIDRLREVAEISLRAVVKDKSLVVPATGRACINPSRCPMF